MAVNNNFIALSQMNRIEEYVKVKHKGIVKWLVKFFDETNEVTGVATILTMVAKKITANVITITAKFL
jgi:hypothetical protein